MNKSFKTAKKLALILSVGCLSLTATANSNPGDEDANLSFSPTEKTGSVVVHAWNLEASAPATIKVLNKYGRTVYQEALEAGEDHKKRYNFSQMKAGRYTLVLESQTKEVSKPFVVGMNGVVREDNTETLKSFSPLITENKNQSSVQVMFDNPVNDALRVELHDKEGRILYSEKVAGNQSYAKSISLKKLPRGLYRVKIFNYDYLRLQDVRH